ncbi:MAG: hypothetical protein AAF183_21450 [Pseudomonadota bacterium]
MTERRHGGPSVEERQAREAEEARRRLERLHEDRESDPHSPARQARPSDWMTAWARNAFDPRRSALSRLLYLASALAFLAWIALQVFRDMP